MTTGNRRRALLALATALGLAVGQALPAAATTTSVAADVVATLVARNPAGLVADDSTSSSCIGGPSPQPLAYAASRLVVRTSQSTAQLTATLNAFLANYPGIPPTSVQKVTRITFSKPSSGPGIVPVLSVDLAPPSPQLAHALVAIARSLRTEHYPSTSLDYVLSPTSGPTGMWPAGPPSPVAASAVPAPRLPGGVAPGGGVSTWVFDTGQAPLAQSNPTPNTSRLAPNDKELLDRDKDGTVDLYYGGHSTHIGGVLFTMASGSPVKLARITGADGIATDITATMRMASSLKSAKKSGTLPGVIVASFGSPACDAGPSAPGVEMVPLGLQAVSESVDREGVSVLVAAAGNRSTDRRFYPAAFDTNLAVGALDATLDGDGNAWTSASRSAPAASFSNYGSWVDAWAPGVGLDVNSVVGLTYDGVTLIQGYAEVAGTSFATPYAAGAIAEVMAGQRVPARQARDLLLASGRTCSAAIGGGTALALTSFLASATTPASAAIPTAC